MKKRLLLFPTLIALLTGCASVPHGVRYATPGTAVGEPKMIRDASLALEVDEVQPAIKAARELVREHNGYIVDLNTDETHSGHLTARVEESKLEDFVEACDELGEVTSSRIHEYEVSGRINQLEEELATAIAFRDRLRELAAEAKDVDDLIRIENKLNEVQQRIDQLERETTGMENQVQYASVNLSLKRPSIPGPLGAVWKSVSWTLKKLFVLRA